MVVYHFPTVNATHLRTGTNPLPHPFVLLLQDTKPRDGISASLRSQVAVSQAPP